MTCNFDKPTQRRGTGSYKWDHEFRCRDGQPVGDDLLPMWVADMDFETAPCITEALQARVAHGIFGYTQVPESYYDAVVNWFSRRHRWTIRREWIQYTSGVIPALSCVIKALTMPGERVLLQTPAFNCFFSSIRNNGCEVSELPLDMDGCTLTDWDAFEERCADEKTTLFVLCNPHNPTGHIWTRDELERMNDICLRHGVKVVSDEIHCELTMPGREYVPFASISQACLENSVTLNSPSKAFNIAGLQIANIVCSQPEWQRRIDRAININEVCDVNPFGIVALQAAYNEGGAWLDALRDYLHENYLALCRFVERDLPQLRVYPLEATYLPWIDIRGTGLTSDQFTALVLEKCHVALSSGTTFGKAGEGYVRLNMACPRSRLLEALGRIKACLEP